MVFFLFIQVHTATKLSGGDGLDTSPESGKKEKADKLINVAHPSMAKDLQSVSSSPSLFLNSSLEKEGFWAW